MYLGIDLGTSASETVLVDDAQRVIAGVSASRTARAQIESTARER
jgi:sugar (pentulose or hexulose) kinase